MLDAMKSLKSGHIDQVPDNMMYPLLRWCSGSTRDLEWCNEVNKVFFWAPNNIKKTSLVSGLRDKNPFIKYPKSKKETEDKVFLTKKELAKQYFRWSEQEFNRNILIIDYIKWEDILMSLGCEDKLYKILNIKVPKSINKNIKKPIKNKGLLDFV